MKVTHRTARKENPGDGGRGPARQRSHAFMADKNKREWAEEALDGRERIERLETALSWFLTDSRFVVSVGGNPLVVEAMLEAARGALHDYPSAPGTN